MCCLTCAYFNPTEPLEHKIARESGQCEGSCGKEWTWLTAFRYVERHDKPLHGVCQFNPAGMNVPSWHVCAQHQVMYEANGWGVTKFKPGGSDTLIAWARKQYLHLKAGAKDWRAQELERVQGQNASLRKQLATARKISASRLNRLQKTPKATPKPVEPPQPAPMPPLRLVS